ncbi:MAG: hypothetical protein AB1522_04390 [Chloroflexota bacterium]
MVSITPGNIVASLTVTEEDIFYALAYRREKPKDWRNFIEYLSDHLADALDQHVYDEIRYLTDAYLHQQEECPHRRTTTVTTGGYHYSAGEVWDDLNEEVHCLDCGAVLTDEEEPAQIEDAP